MAFVGKIVLLEKSIGCVVKIARCLKITLGMRLVMIPLSFDYELRWQILHIV